MFREQVLYAAILPVTQIKIFFRASFMMSIIYHKCMYRTNIFKQKSGDLADATCV